MDHNVAAVYNNTYTAAYTAARTEQQNMNASITRPLINKDEEVVVIDA